MTVASKTQDADFESFSAVDLVELDCAMEYESGHDLGSFCIPSLTTLLAKPECAAGITAALLLRKFML